MKPVLQNHNYGGSSMKLEMSVKVPETGSMEPEILGKLRNWF
jgi:hypothetical protein